MKPGFRFYPLLVGLLTLGLLLAGCASAPATGTYVGPVSGSELVVAMVVDESDVLAYACDGDEVALWFSGPRSGSALDLTSEEGAHLQADLQAETASGNLTLPGGSALAFTAETVSGEAGLYRADKTIDGKRYVGGWILLPTDGQCGAVKSDTGVIDHEMIIDPAQPAVDLEGLGNFSARRVISIR